MCRFHHCPIAPGIEKHTPGTWVTSNEIAKLSQNIASDLYHVFMAGRGLQGLQNKLLWLQKGYTGLFQTIDLLDLHLPNSLLILLKPVQAVYRVFFNSM